MPSGNTTLTCRNGHTTWALVTTHPPSTRTPLPTPRSVEMNASDGETRSKSARVDIVVAVGATVVVVVVVDGGGGAVVVTGSVAEQAAAARLRSVSSNALRTAQQRSRNEDPGVGPDVCVIRRPIGFSPGECGGTKA